MLVAEITALTVQIHFLWIIIAMFGGVARYLYMYLKYRAKPNWTVMLAHMLVSAFAGYMVASVVSMSESDWEFIAAGIGGYMGTEALDWLSRVLKTRFGGSAPLEATHPPDEKTNYFDHEKDKPQ